MDTSLESFHVDDRACGFIVRRRTPRSCRALFAFRDDGLHVVDSTVEHAGDPRQWSRYVRTEGERTLTMTRDGATITVDGTPVDAPADTVPAGIGVLLLEAMLADSDTEAEFHLISEAEPTTPRPAHYSVENPELVELPGGRSEELGVAHLLVDEVDVEHTFWFDSHRVVAADWGLGRSYAVETIDELVAGLDDELTALARGIAG